MTIQNCCLIIEPQKLNGPKEALSKGDNPSGDLKYFF